MTTITKERIELFIKNPLENGLTRGEQMELARIALASLEAEPVAECIVEDGGMCIDGFGEYVGHSLPDGTHQLYTAPPAQVVPDEMYWQDAPVEGSSKAAAYATGWNACRAAMLHSAEPVSQAYKLNALDGNSPVTPDGWISCSERIPAQDDWVLIYSKHGEYMAGQVQGEYVELSDGTLSWLGNVLFWMPLPEPPQEVN
ncbi:TPA: DUF551 domain-containing protein [Escherichia coli]|nr:DUF551 domain-containing protein [Escherichia coli]